MIVIHSFTHLKGTIARKFADFCLSISFYWVPQNSWCRPAYEKKSWR